MDYSFLFSPYILLPLLVLVLLRRLPVALKKRSFLPVQSAEYAYKKKRCMTQSEARLYVVLLEHFSSQFHTFPQQHLSSFLDEKIRGQHWRGALSHIQRKSVDFLVCDRLTLQPLLAIELDDSSHQRLDRIERDEVVERILAQANLRLLRFRTHELQNIGLVIQRITAALHTQDT